MEISGPSSGSFKKSRSIGEMFLFSRLWFDVPLVFSESSKEQFASTDIAEELVRLFQKQTEHEKKEMIFEVLAPLAENGNALFLWPFYLFRPYPPNGKSGD